MLLKKKKGFNMRCTKFTYPIQLFYFIFIYYKKHISSATQSALEIPIQREFVCDCVDLYHQLCLIVSET